MRKAQEAMLLLFQVKNLRLKEYGISGLWKAGVIHVIRYTWSLIILSPYDF